jgi:hypothetical protein
MSRSIFTSISSRFVLAKSISISVSGLWFLPICDSFPDLLARCQFANVEGGNDNRWAAAGIVIFSSVISLTASSQTPSCTFPVEYLSS